MSRATQIGLTDAPLATCRPNDRVGDGETEAGTVALVGCPVKTVKELGAIFRRDARAAVIDHQADSATGNCHSDPYGASRSGVSAGVVHQHGREAVDPLGWGFDPRPSLSLVPHQQSNLVALSYREEAVATRRGNGRDVHRLVSWWQRL